MNAREMTVVMARLLDAYPNAKLRDGTPELYAEMLDDIEFGVAMQSATKIIREDESSFFPTIAAFRRACGRGTVSDEDYAQLAEQRKLARGTIEAMGLDYAKWFYGPRWQLLFPDHEPTERTALEDAIARELAPARPELEAAE